jgi:arylsulfatase A-like enzyme
VKKWLALLTLLGCGSGGTPSGGRHHVIEIDIDDHGLAGLWMANAPNIQGLIARGTLTFSRVIVPTHSNQSNIALLTGQYPDGNDVPSNAWLSRARGFVPPVMLPGIAAAGDYTLYERNPLLTRGDSVYRAVARQGLRSAYVGQLPPFEAGASEVHLPIVGLRFGALTIDAPLAQLLLTTTLHYPAEVVHGYHFDGPPAAGESPVRFTLRDAATVIRSGAPVPDFMFLWDFLALDEDPTSSSGASGPGIKQLIEDYDAGIGDLLSALEDQGILESTDILFTLDHGKVDTHNQVVLGTRGGTGTMLADGQLGALVTFSGPALGITPADYAILNEDGDALIYARVAGAGTPAGAARQAEVTRALLTLIQSGQIEGLDITRTITADGALGTRRFHDYRASSPNQADIMVFPRDDWTLNRVDPGNGETGPFREHNAPFGRHGGFSIDELYVPLIMAGPSFKKGVYLPHPVEHPAVAPTALRALGGLALETAAAGPIAAAFAGDPGEAIPLDDPPAARDLVLRPAGYLGAPRLAGPAASAAVLIDVAGLYDEEVFSDPALAEAAQPLRDLAARGVRFQDFWTRSRDWPVTELEMLAGGYPVSPWFPAAEDDPAQTVAPGTGLLAMPVPAGRVADPVAFQAWRQARPLGGETLLDAARTLALTTVLVGQPDFHDLHVDPTKIDLRVAADPAGAAAAVKTVLADHPNALVLVALGGARTAARRSPAELGTLARAAADVAAAAGGALVLITSRGAAAIDDPGADAYGPGSSHHVPLVLVGPNVRAGVVTGQHGQPADIPATVLFGLGAPTATDFVQGTWARGPDVGGVPQPAPTSATAGHALICGFQLLR